MKRHVSIFLGTFVAGAAIAFGARAALHDPHAGTAPAAEHAMAAADASDDERAGAHQHGHDHGAAPAGDAAKPAESKPPAEAAQPAADKPVNTVCAICGMKVNPKIPTEKYQGKTVGFGCGACPPMFRENPDKYGPAALRNEIVED